MSNVMDCPKVEKRSLKIHSEMLMSTITRQAGTLGKALMEATMNAVDAGSSNITINYEEKDGKQIIIIDDNGRGIETEEEIIKYFETFGTPHPKNDGSIYGEFRMGRGQMFSFGKNIWRTSTFRMTVDIKEMGLNYILERDLEKVEGCHIEIELYKNYIQDYPYYGLNSFIKNVKKQVEFINVDIYFNDEKLNTPPSSLKWDYEDEDAYYLFNVGTEIVFYNLGVFVMDSSSAVDGITGIVVSKHKLMVNQARNDIISDCEIFVRIKNVIREHRVIKTRTRKTLTEYEKQALINDILEGREYISNYEQMALFTTIKNNKISLSQFLSKIKKWTFWTFAPMHNRSAEKMMDIDYAICLSDDILKTLNYNGDKSEFFDWFLENQSKFYCNSMLRNVSAQYKDFQELKKSSNFDESYIVVPEKSLTKKQKKMLMFLNNMDCWDGRKIMIGKSNVANAWTDGRTYICIDDEFINRIIRTDYYVSNFFEVLKHEMAHDDNTNSTHCHGYEFYEKFHELSMESNGITSRILGFQAKWKSFLNNEERKEREIKENKMSLKRDKKLGIK